MSDDDDKPINSWEGLPFCKHGYQIDCTQCLIDSGEYEYVKTVAYILRKKVKPEDGPDRKSKE